MIQADSFALEGDRHLDSIITAVQHHDTSALRLLRGAQAGHDWTLAILAAFGVWVILSVLFCWGWPIVQARLGRGGDVGE